MARILLLVYVQACIIGVAYGAHVPLVPVFAMQELAASYFDIGLIGMANFVPYMFAPMFVGLLLDRFNKASILTVGIGMATFSLFMLAFTNSVLDVMIVRAFSGIAHAFFWPATVAIVTTVSPVEKRIHSVSRFTMAWVGGYMIGPLMGAFLFEELGFRLLFKFSAAIMIGSLAVSLLLIKHGRRGGYVEKYSPKAVFNVIRSNPKLSTLVLYYSAAFGIVLTVFPAYLKDNTINEFTIGILFFIFGLSRLFTLPFTHRFARYEKTSIFLATEAIAFAMLIAYAITNLGSFSSSLIMLGFAFSLYFPITLSVVTKHTPEHLVGTTIGTYEAIFGIGFTMGPAIAGIAADLFGNSTPFIAMFFIGFLLPVIFIKSFNRR